MAATARQLRAAPAPTPRPAAVEGELPASEPRGEARTWLARQLAWERRLETLQQESGAIDELYTIDTGQTT